MNKWKNFLYSPLTFAWVLCIIPLFGFWNYGLFDLDESYYANATVEMINKNEWLVPILNNEPWIDKPVLFFWFSKLSVMAFGIDFGPRLPSALFGLGICGLVYFYTKKFLNQKIAFISMVVFGTNLMHVAIARQIVLDTVFTFFLTWGFFLFYDSLQSRSSLKIGSGICFALCALAKSLIAPFFGIFLALIVYFREKDLRSRLKGNCIATIIVFLIVCGAWFLPVWLKYKDVFWEQYILHNQFNRVVQSYNPSKIGGIFFDLLYFPLLILLGFLPWVFISKSIFKQYKNIKHVSSFFLRFLAYWIFMVLVFFTLVKTKNPQYIYATFPAISILIGYLLESKITLNKFWKLGSIFSFITLGLCHSIFYYHYWGKLAPNLFASPWQLHQLARSIRDEEGAIILYRMREHTTPNIHALKKVPIPVTFYSNKQVLWANTPLELQNLIKSQKLFWILSFANQIEVSYNLKKVRYLEDIEMWKNF